MLVRSHRIPRRINRSTDQHQLIHIAQSDGAISSGGSHFPHLLPGRHQGSARRGSAARGGGLPDHRLVRHASSAVILVVASVLLAVVAITTGKKREVKVEISEKLYPIVVCEHERHDAKPLKSIRTQKLIKYVRPIGQVPPVGQSVAKKEPEIQSFGCKILKAIDDFLHQLHKKNYTLKGKVNITMLCWIKSSKTVKLRKESVPDLEKYTEEGGRMDYASLGTSISKDLFRGLEIPLDVKAWIDLMLDDPIKHKYLIRYNVALLPRRAKIDHFISLYGNLCQLRELAHVDDASNATYYSVLDNIPVANSTPAYEWTSYPMDNKYVEKVYIYKRGVRSSSAFGLLMFVRDCISHLLDYSVKGNVVLFRGDDRYLMIETCFRGIFHQFQRAMSEAGFQDAVLKETL